MAKLAEVMAVAHRHGITHCDIKPKNILIDKLGEPRLIDFGMARLRHAWSDRAPSSWGGTLAYMAPEQARLEIDRIGPRSDIFALGGVLYFLLTGHAPFVGQNQNETWDRARRCDFEAGALRAAKVPRRLERICLKAMAAEPADRHATAEALRKALDRFVTRPRILALAGGVAGLALLGGLAYMVLSSRTGPIHSQNDPAVIQRTPKSDTVVIQPASSAPAPLTGELTVRVWSKVNGAKRGLEVDKPGACRFYPVNRFTSKPASISRRTRTCSGSMDRGTSACSIRGRIISSAAVLPMGRHTRR